LVEVQISEMDALPTPFSLAQQWVGIIGFPCLYHIPPLADVTMETRACSLLESKNDLKALLAWSIKDPWR
jgi:hypothetical protein